MPIELLDKRTFTAKHFDNQDGTFRGEFHVRDIHYKDGALKDGAFQDIDTAFTFDASTGIYSMQKASYEAEIGINGDVRFYNIDHSIKFQLPNPNAIQAVPSDDDWGKQGKGLIWRNIIQDGGHQLVQLKNGELAKVFHFDKKPLSNQIQFSVLPSANLKLFDGISEFNLAQGPRAVSGQQMNLYKSGSNILSWIRRPRAWNHRGEFADVQLTFSMAAVQMKCTKTIPQDFIDKTFNEAGAWLECDTTTSYNAGSDDFTSWSNGLNTWADQHDNNPGGSASGASSLAVMGITVDSYGNYSNMQRGGASFDTSSIPDNNDVTAASLHFYAADLQYYDNKEEVDLVSWDGSQQFYSGHFGTTSFGGVGLAALMQSAWGQIDLNAVGKAAISLVGTTRFGFRGGNDRTNTPSALPPDPDTAAYNLNISSSSSSNPEYLSVTYVAPLNYSYTGSGGAISGGAAVESASIVRSVTGSGGAVSGGAAAASASITRSVVGSGGAISGGAANWSVQHILESWTGSGGGVSGGAAVVSASVVQSFIATGGATSGGTATVSASIVQSWVGSGGAVTGGAAVISIIEFEHVAGGATTGGAAIISARIIQSWVGSGGAVTGGFAITPGMYTTEWQNKGPAFMDDDLLLAQRIDFDKDAAKIVVYRVTARVVNVSNEGEATVAIIDGAEYVDAMADAEGVEFVRVGNQSNTARQGSVYISGDDSGAPFIDVIDGVDSISKLGTLATIKVRIGNLSGITDANFGVLSGYGIYTENAYFKGAIALGSATSISTGAGVWATKDGDFRVGDPSTSKMISFDHSSGVVTLGSGVSLSWASVSGAGKPADNATVGADWASNLTGIPGDLAHTGQIPTVPGYITSTKITATTIESPTITSNASLTGVIVVTYGGSYASGITAETSGDAAVRIWAGATYANRGSAPFMVTQAGAVTCSNLTITGGSINLNSGVFQVSSVGAVTANNFTATAGSDTIRMDGSAFKVYNGSVGFAFSSSAIQAFGGTLGWYLDQNQNVPAISAHDSAPNLASAFVAASSGGALTTQLNKIVVTIAGVQRNLLCL